MIKNKITLITLIFFLIGISEKANAQCPPNAEVFNYLTNTDQWSFCINEGIVDLTQYLNPDFPQGDFFILDPAFSGAISNNQLDVNAITSTVPNTINILPVEYNVNINGTLCVYSNLTFTGINESPVLDPLSVSNIDGTSYCSGANSILINPSISVGAAILTINGESQSLPNVYIPGETGNLVDTITVLYGAGCFLEETFFVNITPTPQLTNPDTLYTTQTAYELQANPAGGDFFVNGTLITDNTIDVSQLTVGTTINVNYDLDGCTADLEEIIIAEEPIIIEEPEDTIDTTPQNVAVFVPNVFTPNFDDANDVVYVRGENLATINFKVFNRYGEKVFETKDQNEGWEGFNLNGKRLNAGVYFYQLLYTTEENGPEILKKGEITLIR